jgi:hypothetical protein
MKTSLIIVDDFYPSPDTVRNYALQQPFEIKGNFPGARTKPYLSDDVKAAIGWNMSFAGGVTDWFEHANCTGCFQITTASDRTWIHSDFYNKWAGVLYLTPDAPYTSGTAFYKHKSTGEHSRVTDDHESYDYTKWDQYDTIGNRYNRLILFRADMFHASVDYFGKDLNDGRLIQVFFFNTARS